MGSATVCQEHPGPHATQSSASAARAGLLASHRLVGMHWLRGIRSRWCWHGGHEPNLLCGYSLKKVSSSNAQVLIIERIADAFITSTVWVVASGSCPTVPLGWKGRGSPRAETGSRCPDIGSTSPFVGSSMRRIDKSYNYMAADADCRWQRAGTRELVVVGGEGRGGVVHS